MTYVLTIYDHNEDTTDTLDLPSAGAARMRMLSDMARVMLRAGMVWSQVGPMLLDLMEWSSRADESLTNGGARMGMLNGDALDTTVGAAYGCVNGCGADVEYTIRKAG